MSLAVVGAPSSAGAYAPGQERAPAALRDAGLLAALRAGGRAVRDRGDVPGLRWAPDPVQPRAANAAVVGRVAGAVAAAVAEARADGAERVLVLGGDCTVGVGTVAGVARGGGRVGLVHLDLHADLNVPASTVDGALDWMGVAHLLGLPGTRAELAAIGPPAPVLSAADVALLGFDPAYASDHERRVIDGLGLAVVDVAGLGADPAGAAAQALASLAGCDALVLHLDIDVVDFLALPLSENVERDGGVALAAALRAAAAVLDDPRTAAMTLAEVNPDHGAADGSTLAELVAGLAGLPL